MGFPASHFLMATSLAEVFPLRETSLAEVFPLKSYSLHDSKTKTPHIKKPNLTKSNLSKPKLTSPYRTSPILTVSILQRFFAWRVFVRLPFQEKSWTDSGRSLNFVAFLRAPEHGGKQGGCVTSMS